MERSELLARLGFAPPEACRVRVIIDTDAKNEGDDDFAILHHLLTPQFDVRGICLLYTSHSSISSLFSSCPRKDCNHTFGF